MASSVVKDATWGGVKSPRERVNTMLTAVSKQPTRENGKVRGRSLRSEHVYQ